MSAVINTSFLFCYGECVRRLFLCIVLLMLEQSHKKRKDSLETQVKLVVLCTYVENQTILEPILLYCAWKCKQNKKQGSKDCLRSHIFTFLSEYYQLFFLFTSWKNASCWYIFYLFGESPRSIFPLHFRYIYFSS